MAESTHSKLRYGMVGGGEGAFIGAVHRMAAALDGDYQLVCGAFSSDAARNRRSADILGIDPARAYPTLEALLAAEAALPEDQRMQALAIVTPNHLHAPAAIAALDAGFHVMSEKPMALNLAEALAIEQAVARSDRLYGLAFTYSGYPLVEEARLRVARGDLGAIRLVQVEYSQGWLSQPIDRDGQKQAEWRTDPARAGLGGCLGDIGTHAFQLAEHVSGLLVEEISADLTTHVPGRRLDDDAAALLRFAGGARGVLKASQIAAGDENGLRLRIHGEKGGLDWSQMEPNTLTLRWLDRPAEIVRAGGPGLDPATAARFRTPAGHPEGYIEAFANLYRSFGRVLRAGGSHPPRGAPDWFPGITDGLRTMTFVEAAIENSMGDAKWTSLARLLDQRRASAA
ncbi:Gfo/Idh/MocA family oxidoreductase [Sphingomonas psychrotolerans]|uniref:Gfo/Idh/MocA family oxidoreductase n=1 Tax=Sphingomonas psychrotolerans TaxID=1327635 RepID=A0ABU3NBZ6_9SPHN|nr:Gfo/Idh/MocA family oxidoreductase [Sphingomonas psychrotolerans]MDT8761011.1 Gfo/Idh/MocA family oxidoreductase [Sphingomonas psychrotolerans]